MGHVEFEAMTACFLHFIFICFPCLLNKCQDNRINLVDHERKELSLLILLWCFLFSAVLPQGTWSNICCKERSRRSNSCFSSDTSAGWSFHRFTLAFSSGVLVKRFFWRSSHWRHDHPNGARLFSNGNWRQTSLLQPIILVGQWRDLYNGHSSLKEPIYLICWSPNPNNPANENHSSGYFEEDFGQPKLGLCPFFQGVFKGELPPWNNRDEKPMPPVRFRRILQFCGRILRVSPITTKIHTILYK